MEVTACSVVVPATSTAPPMNVSSATPRPPAVKTEPLLMDVESVMSSISNAPLIMALPATPKPPAVDRAALPTVVELAAVVARTV
eukprot:3032222-Pyramimonas_sp.AAC.1